MAGSNPARESRRGSRLHRRGKVMALGGRMRIADLMGAGAGGAQIPYDQSGGGDEDVLAGAQAAGQAATPASDPSMGMAPPSLGGLMGDPGQQDMAAGDMGAADLGTAGGMGAVDPA